MSAYTYYYVKPSAVLPFKRIIRRTRGKYCGTTEPIGAFGFRYAIFRNRRSEVLVPTHDLTPETRTAIAAAT